MLVVGCDVGHCDIAGNMLLLLCQMKFLLRASCASLTTSLLNLPGLRARFFAVFPSHHATRHCGLPQRSSRSIPLAEFTLTEGLQRPRRRKQPEGW